MNNITGVIVLGELNLNTARNGHLVTPRESTQTITFPYFKIHVQAFFLWILRKYMYIIISNITAITLLRLQHERHIAVNSTSYLHQPVNQRLLHNYFSPSMNSTSITWCSSYQYKWLAEGSQRGVWQTIITETVVRVLQRVQRKGFLYTALPPTATKEVWKQWTYYG